MRNECIHPWSSASFLYFYTVRGPNQGMVLGLGVLAGCAHINSGKQDNTHAQNPAGSRQDNGGSLPQVIIGSAKLITRNNHRPIREQGRLATPHGRKRGSNLDPSNLGCGPLGRFYSSTQLLWRPKSLPESSMFGEMSHSLATFSHHDRRLL